MGQDWHIRWIVPTLTLAGMLLACAEGLAAPVRTAKEKPVGKQVVPETPVPLDKATTPRSAKVRSDKLVTPESKPNLAKEADRKKNPGRRSHKARRQGPKQFPPGAIVQPKQDLSYMGKFQKPQRYDPSRNYRKGGPPNPQAGDVLHDHFQELDRNRDGVIDPLERASGRLDIDRDLANRQWQ
jgi:hypothetical protein